MPLNESFLDRLAARRRFGMRPGLDTIRGLMAALGNPQDELRCVHIAGTNGKGAVSAMIDSALRAAGYHVARYTSPHLVRLAERFFLDGRPATDERLDAAARIVFPAVEKFEKDHGAEVTFFECLTAVAFVLFRNEGYKYVVLETGLGGRMDATNIIKDPLVSVITRIGLDHCEWLGATHVAIAGEKAGIVKPGRPVVCGAMPGAAREVIARAASLNGCDFVDAAERVSVEVRDSNIAGQTLLATTAMRNLAPIHLPLGGSFQAENAITAIAAMDVLQRDDRLAIPDRAIVSGLSSVVWPGRFQLARVSPPVIVDGAHNPDGAKALRDALRYAHVAGPVGMIAGYCGDKDVLDHLRVMSALVTRGWSTPIRNSRSLDPAAVAERMQMAGFESAEACPNLHEALEHGLAWARESGGSL